MTISFPAHDGPALYREAKKLIPGGTQLLSKRPEMFLPEKWPAYYREASGCEVVGLDGARYVDMSIMGVSACLLGYADPDVTEAVVKRVRAGSMCTLNSPEEVELAQLLLGLHPWAHRVRFGRCGGEVMATAVRIARAKTRRDKVAFCGYHGWHDWYLAANLGESDELDGHLLPGLAPRGVPSQLRGTALPFTYNKPEELEKIVVQHGDSLAAVVMEPTRSVDPASGFLEAVRDLSRKSGAVLIFDEITIGWRLALGGAHLKYGVAPDLAVYAKTLGNGHPIAAIVGAEEVMDASQESFISSTYWTEGVGPTAALATIRKMQQVDVRSHVKHVGETVRSGLLDAAKKNGVPLKTAGHACIATYAFDHPDGLALQTLFIDRMLSRGFLTGGQVSASLAHKDEHITAYLNAAGKVFQELAEAIEKNDVMSRLEGPVRHAGFARLA